MELNLGKKPKKDVIVSVNMSIHEFKRLKRLAEYHEASVSSVVRSLIENHVNEFEDKYDF